MFWGLYSDINLVNLIPHADKTSYKSLNAPLLASQPSTSPQPPLYVVQRSAKFLRTSTAAAAVLNTPKLHNYTTNIAPLQTVSRASTESFAARGVPRLPHCATFEKDADVLSQEVNEASPSAKSSDSKQLGPFWALSSYTALGLVQQQQAYGSVTAGVNMINSSIGGEALQAYAQLGIKEKRPLSPPVVDNNDALLQYARM